ncbi:hypothetical protein O181_013384 [Austropuccinia psidii MF-1]|uniref:Uncharacterized protein n=1 Tax=Austropuccinia psidii MF-1 TaxID=1389203 RepID=A0A9Q3BWB0_9BASI|nr:hypothetical protein [Austropuccinia psidii MF-1]
MARCTNVGGSIPVGGRPINSRPAVQISRINTECVVKRIRRISNSPPDPDSEGSDELDASFKNILKGPYYQYPRDVQPTLVAIPTFLPPASPGSSHTWPAINQAVRPSPIQQSRASPIVTSQQLKPEASSNRRREGISPLPFPVAQVFQKMDCWPIQVTREDPTTVSENQDAVARLFRQVDRNSREVIMYPNDRTIPGTSS